MRLFSIEVSFRATSIIIVDWPFLCLCYVSVIFIPYQANIGLANASMVFRTIHFIGISTTEYVAT